MTISTWSARATAWQSSSRSLVHIVAFRRYCRSCGRSPQKTRGPLGSHWPELELDCALVNVAIALISSTANGGTSWAIAPAVAATVALTSSLRDAVLGWRLPGDFTAGWSRFRPAWPCLRTGAYMLRRRSPLLPMLGHTAADS